MVQIKARTREALPAEKPRAVASGWHSAYPGVGADVLAGLRAETAPVPPTALRKAMDPHWVPNLRPVPLAPRRTDKTALHINASRVHTIACRYDDMADETTTLLDDLAALLPLLTADMAKAFVAEVAS